MLDKMSVEFPNSFYGKCAGNLSRSWIFWTPLIYSDMYVCSLNGALCCQSWCKHEVMLVSRWCLYVQRPNESLPWTPSLGGLHPFLNIFSARWPVPRLFYCTLGGNPSLPIKQAVNIDSVRTRVVFDHLIIRHTSWTLLIRRLCCIDYWVTTMSSVFKLWPCGTICMLYNCDYALTLFERACVAPDAEDCCSVLASFNC